MARNGDKTFVTITNKQIYSELCQFKEDNEKQHNEILLEISKYRSQVQNLKMALAGIGILTMTTLGFLINHLLAHV